MFETSLTTISKPKPKCSQLAELHKVDDYLGPRFSSVFLLCFQPCWPCREALLARDSENITVKFENTKQNSTLLSVMTGGTLNIYPHIYKAELLLRFLLDKHCVTDYPDRHLEI